MEIIFHGKPNSHSIYATHGIPPTLQQKITDTFFESRGGIPNDKGLVVETYFWQQRWYSVYTFSMAKLKGSEDRPNSYFSISLVFQDAYNLLTSYIYKYLEDTYYQFIENQLISKAGKYLKQDFVDTKYFESIITHIQKGFVNLQDPLNSSFAPKRSNQEIRYNLQDCDALTFIQDLQKNGRIVVAEGEGFPPKCSANELAQREQIISNLSEQLKKKESELTTANTTFDNAKNDINKKVTALEKERDGYKKSAEDLQAKQKAQENLLIAKQNELDDLVSKMRALLPNTNKPTPKPNPDPSIDVVDNIKGLDKYVRFLPIVNCLLLLMCVCMLLIGGINGDKPNEEEKALKKRVTQLIQENAQKDKLIEGLKNEVQRLKATPFSNYDPNSEETAAENDLQNSDMDVDCEVTVYASGKPIDNVGSKIANGTTVTITWTPENGYSWHGSGESEKIAKQLNEANPQGSASITIKSTIYIWYRREDPSKRHESNKIKLTTN